MSWLIWPGAVVSFLGVVGILRCVQLAARARSAALDPAAMTARLQRLVAYNMAALAVSAIGLMMVVIGILLA